VIVSAVNIIVSLLVIAIERIGKSSIDYQIEFSDIGGK